MRIHVLSDLLDAVHEQRNKIYWLGVESLYPVDLMAKDVHLLFCFFFVRTTKDDKDG